MVLKTSKDINCENVSLTSLIKMSAGEIRNIKDAIRYYLDDVNLHYNSPSDRCYLCSVEGVILKDLTIDLVLVMKACFRGELRSSKRCNTEVLDRAMIIKANYSTKALEEDFGMQIKWALDYYGHTLLYDRTIKSIDIVLKSKEYNVTIK